MKFLCGIPFGGHLAGSKPEDCRGCLRTQLSAQSEALRVAKEALEEIAKNPLYEYGEDDADDLETLREAGEGAGMGICGEQARAALTRIKEVLE